MLKSEAWNKEPKACDQPTDKSAALLGPRQRKIVTRAVLWAKRLEGIIINIVAAKIATRTVEGEELNQYKFLRAFARQTHLHASPFASKELQYSCRGTSSEILLPPGTIVDG